MVQEQQQVSASMHTWALLPVVTCIIATRFSLYAVHGHFEPFLSPTNIGPTPAGARMQEMEGMLIQAFFSQIWTAGFCKCFFRSGIQDTDIFRIVSAKWPKCKAKVSIRLREGWSKRLIKKHFSLLFITFGTSVWEVSWSWLAKFCFVFVFLNLEWSSLFISDGH